MRHVASVAKLLNYGNLHDEHEAAIRTEINEHLNQEQNHQRICCVNPEMFSLDSDPIWIKIQMKEFYTVISEKWDEFYTILKRMSVQQFKIQKSQFLHLLK